MTSPKRSKFLGMVVTDFLCRIVVADFLCRIVVADFLCRILVVDFGGLLVHNSRWWGANSAGMPTDLVAKNLYHIF